MEYPTWAKLLFACFLFFIGHTLVWFQINSQFIWSWWRERPLVSIMFFSYPISFLFYYAARYTTDNMESMWSARLLGFGISFLSFPILTYLLYKESMFEPKTLICIGLSVIIILVQVLME
jgi:hypothetical protein